MGLGNTIVEKNESSNQDHAKAMIFFDHHLDERLKIEYLTVKDPLVFWQDLKERFDHLKLVVLPKVRYDWLHLRQQDFKSVNEYNSAMFRIIFQLSLSGEKVTDKDMLEKIFSTFHVSNMLLQQQYREKGFKKYSELIKDKCVETNFIDQKSDYDDDDDADMTHFDVADFFEHPEDVNKYPMIV
ncbi:uncharacterized protein [Coffea arabica]|uniref:Retrotransposon gag domain-containing protein n=1 Tax=Coffea arabica TaxID=13443 RepID=A0ABM4WPL0_COFAR